MERIEHDGIVERVCDRRVWVGITAQGACAGCQAREACGMGESEYKVIEVTVPAGDHYVPGDRVTLCVARAMGLRAVGWAYVGPLVALCVVIGVTLGVLGWSEGAAMGCALGALVVYYLLLGALRRRIEKRIYFTIKRR